MSREFKRQPSPQPLTLAVRIRTKGTPGAAAPASAPAAAPAAPATPPATKSSSLQGALESVTRPVSTEIAQALPPGLPGPPADSAPVDPTALGATAAAPAATPANLNVIYVTDVDMMHSEFLRVRAQPNMSDIEWKFDNVTFVLNVIDDLASDNRFLDVRKKQTRHSTLKLVESQTSAAREAAEAEILGFEKEFKTAEDAAKAKQKDTLAELQKKVDDLTQQAESSGTQPTGREIQRALQSALQQMGAKQEVEQRRLDSMVERLTKERDKKLQKIERELDSDVQKVQNSYKGMALFLPMLPPLVVGLLVFLRRRSLESEGVTADRRR